MRKACGIWAGFMWITAKRIADALGVTLEDIASTVSVSDHAKLSPDETRLVEDYRTLNKDGREYIRQTMLIAKQAYSGKNDDLPQMENA